MQKIASIFADSAATLIKTQNEINPQNFTLTIGILRQIGFSLNQSRVYYFLTKHGPMSARQLSQELKIPRTEVYHLVKLLIETGVVVSKGIRPYRFHAIPLEEFWDVIINKEKEKLEELETLLRIYKLDEKFNLIQIKSIINQ